jgi:hypothetical protein
MAALIGTGLWWLWIRYGGAMADVEPDELRRLAEEAMALKVHGAAAFATLFAIGAMSAHHMRRGWALRRNRLSGAATVALLALLIATGYAMYYLVDDQTHMPVAALHWAAGLVLAPMLITHIAVGRKRRDTASGPEPR